MTNECSFFNFQSLIENYDVSDWLITNQEEYNIVQQDNYAEMKDYVSTNVAYSQIMELFSRRRWATGFSQQYNKYGILPWMCYKIYLCLT